MFLNVRTDVVQPFLSEHKGIFSYIFRINWCLHSHPWPPHYERIRLGTLAWVMLWLWRSVREMSKTIQSVQTPSTTGSKVMLRCSTSRAWLHTGPALCRINPGFICLWMEENGGNVLETASHHHNRMSMSSMHSLNVREKSGRLWSFSVTELKTLQKWFM
jgi:hypothetical protein